MGHADGSVLRQWQHHLNITKGPGKSLARASFGSAEARREAFIASRPHASRTTADPTLVIQTQRVSWHFGFTLNAGSGSVGFGRRAVGGDGHAHPRQRPRTGEPRLGVELRRQQSAAPDARPAAAVRRGAARARCLQRRAGRGLSEWWHGPDMAELDSLTWRSCGSIEAALAPLLAWVADPTRKPKWWERVLDSLP